MSYSMEELAGAVVVDSEGYKCGNLEKVEAKSTGVVLIVRDESGGESPIPWGVVQGVGISNLGKCVVLGEPLEALARGIKPREKPPYVGTEYVKDRLVIDSNAKIVGSAVEVVFGLSAYPQLKVVREVIQYREAPDLEGLLKSLVPSKFKEPLDLYRRIARDLKLKGKFTARDIKERYLIPWAQSMKIKIPKMRVLKASGGLSIDWDDIYKIGDVIILREPVKAAAG